MHWVAQKMIDEFDENQHVYFALPFVKTMAGDFGLRASLSWVLDIISNGIHQRDSISVSLDRVRRALASNDDADLHDLDALAWSHWCCGDVPNQKKQKSTCRIIWAVMNFVSHENDVKFDTQNSGLTFDGRTDEQYKSCCRQAASALNLAHNLDRSADNSVRLELSKNFTREMVRLDSSA
jgi:hypothetical protein